MESTDSNATQKSNDPYEEDQGNTNQAGDHDLWPDGGMVCPVTGCGTKFYVNLTTYWGHWKRKHLKQLRQLYCPKCSHKSLNKRYFATHLTKKHKIKLSDLDQIIASAHTELIPNKEFIPPGTQRCPKRKSLNSESQMAPKRRRMKSPSQDSQCKHDEDNSSMTAAGSVEFPKGKVHDLSVSERRTKRPKLSAAQVLEIKQGSGGEKKSTKQTDFNEPAVASNLGSDLGIQSDNKKYVDDFGFEDKRILQVGLKVDMAPAISKEDSVSNDIVKQVVAVLEREETEINESVTVVTESSVEIKRKDPDVDIATVESDKAIDTQVLECVSKLMEGVVEMKRKVTIESEKIIDTQVSESFTNVTESAVQIKRKFAVVDKGTIEMEKPIDTQVLECIPKVTESGVQIGDVDKGIIEMKKPIDTQVLECIPKVTQSVVQIVDVDKGTIEMDKDTQVSVRVGTSDIQRNVDSKKVSEAARKIETVTDSASIFHDIPSDRIRKEADKSITEIPESSCIRIRQREDEEKIYPSVETETVNDKERHGIYISYDTVITKGDDKSEYNDNDQSEYKDKDQSECDIKDQSEYNDNDQKECDIKGRSEFDIKDQSEYNDKDQSEYNDKDQSECDIKDRSEYNDKDQSECDIKDQSECDIKDQSDHNESDQDLTVTDDSELDEAKEAEDLDTVVRPIFLDGQMLCPGSGCLDLDQVYDSLKAFYKHWQDEHQSSVQRFECPSCSFKDVRKLEIRRHLKTEHNITHRGVLEELMSLVKLESTLKTAEDSKSETSSKRKSTSQLKTKIKKQKIPLESDADETKAGKDTKDESPKDEGAIRAEIQCVGESSEKLSPKKEKVVWFFGMSCPAKNCCTRKFVSPREFHNHWENVHNPYIKKFECPICQYQNTQREVVGNHLRLFHNAVKTNDVRDLSQIKMVDVGNPMYKDPGMFYFGNVSSMPVENQDVKATTTMSPVQVTTSNTSEALVESTKKSPSKNEQRGLESLSSKSGAREKEPIKVAFVSNMLCPVDNCGFHIFTTLAAFASHWKKIHLPHRDLFECRFCKFRSSRKQSVYVHIQNVHEMRYHAVRQNISKVLDINVLFHDPFPFYFEKSLFDVFELTNVSDSTSGSKSASGLQKKEDKAGTDGIHELKKAEDTGTQANEESEKISKDSIPVHWVLGMSCPVMNCGASYFMTFLSFQSHWENIHNINILKFKCPKCTYTNITKANVIAHLSVQHKMSDAMIKAKTNQIQNVKVKNNRYIDPGFYSFSVMEQFQNDQTNTSPSEKKEMDLGGDLKGKIEKTRKVTWMEGMSCPVKACGSETYLTLDSFSNHWIKTHHLELNMFQCSQCAFKAIQKSEIENHLKSHHWILAEKDVMTALTKVNVVKVLNPAFKDIEGYYFESPGIEEEAECSLSKSENKPSEQASNEIDFGGDLIGKIEKTRKVTWIEGMSCPVKACGSETYLTLDSFCNHWIKTHHLELNMFQCSQCIFKAIQKSEIENHLKSHHWILAEKDLMTALTKVNVVKVLNPEFKDTESYYFESAVVPEEEAECSLSKSENKPSEQASNVTIGACEASVKSMKNSPSENEEVSLKSVTSNSAAGNKEPIKVVFVSNMRCPVDKCCTRGFRKLSNFKNHWKARHLPFQEDYICKICNSKKTAENCKSWRLKNIYWHIENVHRIKHPTIEKNIIIEHNTNFHFVDPGLLYFENVARSTDGSQSASSIQKKEEKESKSMSEEGMPKIVVEWKYNMTCPIRKCDFEIYDSWTTYCKHWKMVHEQRYLKTHACPKCSFQSGEKSHMVNHMKQCHNLVGRELERAAEQIKFVDVENPSFIDPGNYTLNWLGKSNENKKSSTTASSEISKSEATLQKKDTEPTEKEGRYHKEFIFAPGMPCPVKNCSSGQISSYSAFVHHLKQHDLMLKKFACTMCTFTHIQKSIVFMHVRKEHGMPSHIITQKITMVMETNVKAEELFVPDLPTDPRGSIVMVKPDDSEATLQKKDTEPTEKEGRYNKEFIFAPGMPCPVKNCSSVQISSYSAFVHHWNEQHDLMLKKFACTMCNFTHIQKSIVFMHVRNEHGMPSYVIPKKIKTVNSPKVKAEELFVPDLPTDHRRSIVMVNPDDSGQINTYDTNGGKIKEVTDVVEEIKKSDENIGKLNEQKDESRDESDKDESKGQKHEDTCTGLRDEKKPLESTQPADVDRENVLINNPTQMVYKSCDNDTKLRMSASENQEEKETGAFEEVLPDSSAEQPTLTVTVQTEVKQLVCPKDIEDTIEKEKLYVKGKDESTKEAVKIVMPSGSSDVPKIVVDDEDVISDFEEDSVTVDMSEFICLDEIGEEDTEASEMSPEKQIAKETELPGDQDYEIQDEVSPPTEDDQMEDILKYFICIDDIGGDKDDIGDDKDDIGDENDDIGNEKDNIGNEKDDIGNEKDNIGDEERS